MRLLRLDLTAFGPFTGVALDLDSEGPALHVVYGHNEAGKSTALRALSGVLFGIPERTQDAHLHPMDRLRVGAVLASSDGGRISIVRRKGRKNTLLDGDGEPVDEALLARCLRGITRERFATAFALDHETLRSGAEALLAGRGDVGESLFDAGLGGRSIREVLAELDREAEALFAPRGRKKLLNEAIDAFKKARKLSVDEALSAGAWREQKEEIDRVRARFAELREERTRLGTEQRRLERDARVLPHLQRRAELLRERDEGDQQGGGELAAIPDESIAAIHSRLGSHRKAAGDLPDLDAKLCAAEDEVRKDLRQLAGDVSLEEVESLRIDAAAQTRIRKLAGRPEALIANFR